jgi:hypothetical protein
MENDIPYIITLSSNRDTMKIVCLLLMSMSIAQEQVLGLVMFESQFNSPKIRVMSIKKGNFVKVHKWGTRSTIFHAQPDI